MAQGHQIVANPTSDFLILVIRNFLTGQMVWGVRVSRFHFTHIAFNSEANSRLLETPDPEKTNEEDTTSYN